MLLNITNLNRGYIDGHRLFQNFDFELNQGDFCFVMGRSGSGKTTLVKFLMRQITPPAKTVFYKDEDLSRLTELEVQNYRRKIGVIFQDYKLISDKTVAENIVYPLEVMHLSPEEREAKLTEALARVHMSDKRDTKIHSLSGGEKQKVAIARALITDPAFIIADEPTGNLDQDASRMIADILIEAHKAGNTILFITHDNALMEYVRNKHEVRLFTM